MRRLLSSVAATAALLAAVSFAPTQAQAANAAASVVASRPASVQLVAEGCGPRRHRVWRHHRSFCVHD